MKPPTITSNGPATRISARTVLPASFTAMFALSGSELTLGFVVQNDRVRCESMSLVTPGRNISNAKLKRLPLATEYIPAAIEAASATITSNRDAKQSRPNRGTGKSWIYVQLAQGEEVVFRSDDDLDEYRLVARKVGRPKFMGSPLELAEIAKVYKASGGSLAMLTREFGLDKTTIWRRLNEARKLGLLPEKGTG